MTIQTPMVGAKVPSAVRREASTRLHGHARNLSRAAWLILITFDLALFGLALPATYTLTLQQGLTVESSGLAQLGLSPGFYAAFHTGLAFVGVLLSLAAGVFLFWSRSDDWMVWLVSLVLVGIAPGMEIVLGDLVSGQPGWLPLVSLQFSLGLCATLFLVFTFPNGRFVPRWTPGAFLLVTLLVAANAIANVATQRLTDPQLEWILIYSLGFVAQLYRYRRSADPIQRQQFKWIVLGFLVYAPTFTVYSLLRTFVAPSLSSPTRVLYSLAGELVLFYIPALLLYLTAIFATLRYRLWEIDLLINRTLVYVPLTAILAGLFAASITLSQKAFVAFTGQQSDAATVLTTLVVVAAFTPIKERLQSLADRSFREPPNAVKELKAFGEHVRLRVSPVENRQIMRRLVDVAVEAFGASGGAAYWGTDLQAGPIYTSGEWKNDVGLRVPVETNGKKLGTVSLCARRNGASYTAQEREALRETAEVVAVAIEQDGEGDT